MKRPLVSLTLIYAAATMIGVRCSQYRDGFLDAFIATGATLVVLCITKLILGKKGDILTPVARIIAVTAIAFAGTYLAANALNPRLPANHISRFIDENGGREKALIAGEIVEPPRRYPDRTYIVVDTTAIKRDDVWAMTTGRVRVAIMRDVPDVAFGDRVMFPAALRAIENFNNPGGFDYRRFLAAQGVFARTSVSSGNSLQIFRDFPPPKMSFRERIEGTREHLTQWILSVGKDVPSAGVMAALIVGNRDFVPDDINDAFTRVGTMHLLSVSGLHLAIVGSFFFFITRWLLGRSERIMLAVEVRRIAALVSLPPMILYCLMAGANPPTVRSVVMTGAYALSLVFNRLKDLPSTMALAALAILVASPLSMTDAGFILSFTAVAAIILSVPLLEKIRTSEPPEERDGIGWKLKYYLLTTIVISVAVTVFTAPITVTLFNRVSALSPIGNIVYVPLIGYVSVICGLAASALHFLWPHGGDVAMRFAIVTLDWFVESMKTFGAFGSKQSLLPTPTAIESVLIMAATAFALAGAGTSGRRRLQLNALALVCVLSLVLDASVWYIFARARGDLRVVVLDAGEGAAAVIHAPNGGTIVVDTGPSFAGFDSGERIVGPYLLHERIKRIDALILTHPHGDHAGGFGWLMDNFDVREVWLADVAYPPELMEKINRKIAEKQVVARRLSVTASPFDFGGAKVDIQWPTAGVIADEPNDASLLLKIAFGNAAFVFPGDNTEKVHGAIFASGKDYRSTVLVVPHHGAKNGLTDTMLDAVSPRFAVISSRYSMYQRFPSQETLDKLAARRIPAFRTDRYGALRFRTDGSSMEISAWEGNGWRRFGQ